MDSSSLQVFIDWIAAHHHWAYFFVFIIAGAESLAVVGVLVPGIALMLGIGTLVGLGALHLGYCLLWAVLGAIAGDGISFWLGRRYRDRLKNLWPLTRYPDLVPRGEAFFVKHGGKGILLGRFFGPVRAIVPAVAGMLDMPPGRFYSINILSAIAWAPAVIIPGVVFGASLSLAAEVTSRLAGLVLGFLIVAWLWFRVVRRVAKHLQPRAHAMVQRVGRLGDKRIVGRMVRAVLDPEQPELGGLLALTLVLVLAMVVFLYFLIVVNDGDLYFRVDAVIEGQLRTYQMPWLHVITAMVVGFGAPVLALVSGAAITAFLYVRRYRVAATHWLSAMAFAFLAPLLIGYLLGDAAATAGAGNVKFIPDLSLLLTTVMTGMLCVMLSRELPGPWRWLPYSMYAVILLAVSFAYFYWHETLFFNVFGGISLGLMMVAVLGIAYQRHADRALPVSYLVAISFVLLALPMLWGEVQSDGRLPRDSSLQNEVITAQMWWAEGWREVTISKRIAKIRQVHPITWQWAGELGQIESALAKAGWQRATPLSWRSSLYWLAPATEITALPVLPHVYAGFFPALTLVHARDAEGEISVLRIWRSDHQLASGGPIWIGNVSVSVPQDRVPLVRFLVTRPDYETPLRDLYRQLQALPFIKGKEPVLQHNLVEHSMLLLRW